MGQTGQRHDQLAVDGRNALRAGKRYPGVRWPGPLDVLQPLPEVSGGGLARNLQPDLAHDLVENTPPGAGQEPSSPS